MNTKENLAVNTVVNWAGCSERLVSRNRNTEVVVRTVVNSKGY